MIPKEQVDKMSLGDIKSLRIEEFMPPAFGTPEQHEVYQALVTRFNELDPEFGEFLEHVRPDLMSSFGSPGAFQHRVGTMSPFEVIRTWSVLTAGNVDEMSPEDMDFCARVHKVMWRKILSVFGNEMPPVQLAQE